MRWLALGAIASGVVAIGLGGSARAADPGLTKDSIKIGVFGPMTGPASAFGNAQLGIRAVYLDLNEHGGINGRKLEVVLEDTACDPAKGIAATKKLIAQDQVFLLHGGSCSNVVMAIKPDVIASGVPYVVATAANGAITDPVAPNVFQTVATTATMGRTMVDFAMTKPGAKRIALISHSDEWGKSGHDPAVDELKTKFNLAPVADVAFERGSINATPQVLQIKGANPDFIVAILYPAEFAIFVRDASKYGLNVPAMGGQSISIEDTARQVGNPAIMKNVYVFYPLAAQIGEAKLARWVDIFKKYNPGVRVETNGLLGLGGAEAVIEALRRAGPDLTRAKFTAALDNMHSFDSGVLAAPLEFSPTHHAGMNGGATITYVGDKLVLIHKFTDVQK
jgi:branched-chain amino acid transport system substrate-binding protein